jgi:hypothetical protein
VTGSRDPRPATIEKCRQTGEAGEYQGAIRETLGALSRLSGSWEGAGSWVSTGDLADAMGLTVVEAAARLRVAHRQGLCVIRRSLRDGTSWKLTPGAGLRSGANDEDPCG